MELISGLGTDPKSPRCLIDPNDPGDKTGGPNTVSHLGIDPKDGFVRGFDENSESPGTEPKRPVLIKMILTFYI